MSEPIVIDGLVKTYKGGFRAVDELSLTVPKKGFVGFLGPNGAGKTTTIKIMTNMLSATSGHVYINGTDATEDPKKALADVGAVVETPEFYPYLTPMETLEYLGKLRGMSSQDIKKRSKDVLELVKMEENKDKRIGEFSKGMKQRIAIAQAVLHEPSVIILDEPTSGLDPRGMFEVRQVLNDLKKADFTIFMSSHMLNEVQEVCTHAFLINRGRLIKSGLVSDLVKETKGKKIEVRTANPIDIQTTARMANELKLKGLFVNGPYTFTFDVVNGDEEQAKALLDLQALGLKIVSYKESGVALESFYMSLISDTR
ncbi:MAG: ABC transporter ATP-binding protein [Methanomassiliicoccales archaeon]|nr:MAG: ABC transporter ATP-binding protein [Methanomassiliicoccales archaeon]